MGTQETNPIPLGHHEIDTKKKFYFHQYTAPEVIELCQDDTLLNKAWFEANRSGMGVSSLGHNGEKDWDNGIGYTGALDLQAQGWHEGADKAEKLLSRLSISSMHQRQDVVWTNDVAGDEVDMDAYLAGDPENMLEPVEQFTTEGGRSVLKVCVNFAASSGVTASVTEKHGSMVFALVQALENQGKSVELWACMGVQGFWGATKGKAVHEIKIKDSDQYLDKAIQAFWLAHPAAFRRLGFRLLEITGDTEKKDTGIDSCYGQPMEHPHADRFDVYFGNMHLDKAARWRTDQDIRDAIEAELKALGIEPE